MEERAFLTIEEFIAKNSKIWKTSAGFFSWLRGNLRRAVWKNHPVKLQKIKTARYKGPGGKPTKRNPTGRIWVARCERCKERHKLGNCEVDHIIPAGSLRTVEDIKDFVLRMAFVTEDDLRILCKPCHKIVTLAQRRGITEEAAEFESRILNYMKMRISEQKAFLVENGFAPNAVVNKTKREACFRKLVTQEMNNESEGRTHED